MGLWKKTCTLILLSACGCTAEAYKEAADRKVYGILEKRKQETLGY
jgi:hypothetical protein